MLKPLRLAQILALPLVFVAVPAMAADVTIGMVAPASGSIAVLGNQVRDGAGFQAAALGDTVVTVEDSCTAGGGEAIASALIEAKVSVALGFLCSETLEEALPRLAEAGIPAITLGIRSDVLMADALKNQWPLFRLGPSGKAEVDRIAEIISTEWSAEPFALVDDGALGNHDLTESLRSALEAKNVKPVLVDNLRPGQDQQLTLVRHLASADVVRAFVAADRDDVAVVSNSLNEREAKVSLLAGASIETTPGRIDLAPGVQALCLADAADRPENAGLVKGLKDKGIEPEGYVLPAVAAIDIANAAVPAAGSEATPVASALLSRAFDTVMGPIRFTDKHELTENPYQLCSWSGRAFVPTAKQ